MRSASSALGIVLGACAAIAAVALPATPLRAAERVLLTYEAYAAGLHSMTAEVTLERSAETFAIDFAARPDGLPGLFADFQLVARAEGIAGGGGPIPSHYRNDYTKPDKHRWARIDYRAGSIAEAVADPPPEDDNRRRVPSALWQDALDPVTAVLALVEDFARNGRCGGSVEIYDGRRLFRLSLAEGGTVELPKSRLSAYHGPAVTCRATLERLAGFKDNEIRKRRFPNSFTVFLAPLISGHAPLPVRIEFDNEAGAVRVYAVAVDRILPRDRQRAER